MAVGWPLCGKTGARLPTVTLVCASTLPNSLCATHVYMPLSKLVSVVSRKLPVVQ